MRMARFPWLGGRVRHHAGRHGIQQEIIETKAGCRWQSAIFLLYHFDKRRIT
ncbi:hypothetical protein EV586_101462 [Tumebacillus sp. BK434]|nr:hypothetical protein EV586_101462 [Tumebacillus sp. BK434]